MSIFIVLVCLWSLLFSIFHWSKAVIYISNSFYGDWSKHVGNAVMFSVVCIDSFLRIFSPLHTGLW